MDINYNYFVKTDTSASVAHTISLYSQVDFALRRVWDTVPTERYIWTVCIQDIIERDKQEKLLSHACMYTSS